MKVSTLGYSCGQGIKNIKRNKLFSLASIGTITACVFLIGLFYIILANFQYLVKEAEESVCVTVFFNEGTDESIHRVKRLGNSIKHSILLMTLNLQMDLRMTIHWQNLQTMRYI